MFSPCSEFWRPARDHALGVKKTHCSVPSGNFFPKSCFIFPKSNFKIHYINNGPAYKRRKTRLFCLRQRAGFLRSRGGDFTGNSRADWLEIIFAGARAHIAASALCFALQDVSRIKMQAVALFQACPFRLLSNPIFQKNPAHHYPQNLARLSRQNFKNSKPLKAQVVKLVDTLALGASARKGVGVRVPS